jgi:nitroreductase
MELMEAICGRRSIRKFKKEPVPDAMIRKVIEAAAWAPSACNLQGWKFIVVDDPKIREELSKLDVAYFLKSAPQGIMVLYDNRTDNLEYMDHVQSAAASIQNMLLAAHTMGIGTCWVCHLPRKEELRRLFGVPHYYDPVAYVALGFYDSAPSPVRRKQDLDNIIAHNSFDFKENHEKRSDAGISMKRGARKAYYLMPARIRIMLQGIARRFEKRFD